MTTGSRPPARARVLECSGQVTVQDPGRRGFAHLGVPRSGWLDDAAARAANRLVGNPDDTAVLELGFGALTVVADEARWWSVTGADCPVLVGGAAGVAAAHGTAVWVPRGAELVVGTPRRGVRSYLATAGGIAVSPVLGSRATDTLSGIGPRPLAGGVVLPLGTGPGRPAPHGAAVPPADTAEPAVLRITPGPRVDWFAPEALGRLTSSRYVVQSHSDRVGVRLDGPELARAGAEELPSEGVVLGAVQVPADGRPLVFLADHPTTGGYPVIAVVHPDDLGACAQARPGCEVRFRLTPR